ncbi:MAG: hypothetical protein AB1689_02810 [Thermodesulfobacteriota bacterium]
MRDLQCLALVKNRLREPPLLRVTGRHLLRTLGDEEIGTFVPAALPPRKPPLVGSGERAALLGRAEVTTARDMLVLVTADRQRVLAASRGCVTSNSRSSNRSASRRPTTAWKDGVRAVCDVR